MNKKGLFGKIILIIGIIILLAIGYLAFTAYQVFSFVSFIQQEAPLLQSDLESVGDGDCSKLDAIKTRINNIKSEAEEVCGNYLIRKGLEKVESIPIACDNLDSQFNDAMEVIQLAEEGCSNS